MLVMPERPRRLIHPPVDGTGLWLLCGGRHFPRDFLTKRGDLCLGLRDERLHPPLDSATVRDAPEVHRIAQGRVSAEQAV
jgi:hypothetical protein